MTPAQASYRRDLLNYLQYIGFHLEEALRMIPKDPKDFKAFRMAFMVEECREPATDPKELS